MPQETNLNVSPYFDDFDPTKNYYKVLFKPGYPVQARELTTLQSILQNQTEQFGTHIFREGAKVIPGQTLYNTQYSVVEIENSFTGIPVSSYIKSLVGTTIKGETSGVRARVESVLLSAESDRENASLYISYISSGSTNSAQSFSDGENLLTESGLQTSNIIFIPNENFATTVSQNSTSVASSFTVQDGVYFLRGTFVNISTQTIILDQYFNTPTYRIGFNIIEETITSDTDETLYDNSQGFNNYTSPGADRLKITAILTKKSILDFDDKNFVEIATVQNGLLRNTPNDTQYNLINDTLAARTYEESGDYYIKPFKLTCVESLNDEEGNNGIFKKNQLTYNGGTPSDNLAVYKISPGKAYVRGYRVDTTAPTFLDVEKPRDRKELKEQGINYLTGPAISLNNVSGSPVIGIGNTYVVSLRDSRIANKNVFNGNEIGVARVYDFALESGSYNTTNPASNEWDISLYDIQTYTNVVLNQPVTLSASTYVKGRSSGATGFVKTGVTNQTEIQLQSVKGSFIVGENFSFNGTENGRVSTAVTTFGVEDVQSIYGFVGAAGTFNADTTQTKKLTIGEATISLRDAATNTSIVTIPNLTFSKVIKKGNLISYFDSNNFILETSASKGITSISSAAGETVFAIENNPGYNDVYVNGIKLASSEYVSLGATAIQLNVGTNFGDEVEVNAFVSGIRQSQEVVAYQGQTVIPFSTTTSLTTTDKNNTQLYINGIKIDDSLFNIYTGTGIIHLNTPPTVDAYVAIREYAIGSKIGLSTVTTSIATTSFTAAYTPGREEVYVNGVKLLKNTEYTATSGAVINLVNDTNPGDIVEIVQQSSITGTATTITAVGLQTGYTVPSYNSGYVDVFYNGVLLRPTEFIENTATEIYVPNPAVAGDRVEIISYPSASYVSSASTITSSESQDDFIPNNSSKDYEIFVDGVKYNKNDFVQFAQNSSFLLNYKLFTNDLVEVILYGSGNYFSGSKFTATKGQQTFTVSYTPGFLDVYVNGIKLDYSNYDALSGTSVVFGVGLSAGDIVEFISYSTSAFSIQAAATAYDKSYAKVKSIGTNNGFTTLIVEGTTSVAGVNNGNLPKNTIKVSDLEVISTKLPESFDNTLYTPLSRRNVSDINLSSSNLTIRKQYDVVVSANSTNTVIAAANETFLPFDEERYILTFSDGTVQALRSDMFTFGAGSTRLTINGINESGNARLIATLRKINVVSKAKENQRSSSLIVSYSANASSGIGTTTLNDGLSHGNYPYGTRVQDEEISLNVPDIIKLRGVFESYGTDNPSAPRLSLESLTGPNATTADLILGETVRGALSGARATYVEKTTDTTVEIVYLNQKSFTVGEILVFEESGIESRVSSVTANGKDITSSYILDNGQRDTFYDYGRIRRISEKDSPKKKIKVYFQYGYYSSNDDGDVTTVNSYNSFNFNKDVPYYNELRNTDIIDIRPRVASYTVSSGAKSPFEFSGRSFAQSGNSAKNILASDEQILLDFKFYLPRIDKVFLNKNGIFKLVQGVSSETPNPPTSIDDAIEVAQIFLPPYLYNTQNASVSQQSYKRYTMADISRLETRINSLEKFTTLSLLETDTANLSVPDKNGINQFKSGFLVDNFKNSSNQDVRNGVKNSINPNVGEIRPSHYTSAIDLILGSNSIIGIGQSSNPYADLNYVTDLQGSNVKKTGDVISLDYTTTEWLSQPFATRTEQISPYLVNFWEGTLDLTPDSDIWVDSVKLDPENLNVAGNFTSTIDKIAKLENYDSQIGFIPTIWESWNIIWTGNRNLLNDKSETRSTYTQFFNNNGTSSNNGDLRWIGLEKSSDGVTIESITSDTDKTYSQTIDTQEFETLTVGDKSIASEITPFIRSRNVEFVSKRLQPYSRMYAFFDGVDVNNFVVPKLVEITMDSGVFSVGETVSGFFPGIDYDDVISGVNPKIAFRVAISNHKFGPYNAPTETHKFNPYNSDLTVPAQYSSTSTLLNIDTYSLANKPQGEYFGFIAVGMKLYGQTSGAQATVQNVRIVNDSTGTAIGSFYIPDPNVAINPKFTTGEKVFKLTNSSVNSSSTRVLNSVSEDKYLSVGTIEAVEDDIASIKSPKKISKFTFKDSVVSSFGGKYIDPLAQTFIVDDETGVFLTGLDIYFKDKDDELPVTCQLRTVDFNQPSDVVLPFSEVTLDASSVVKTSDATTPTHFAFNSPVYLEGKRNYAIVLSTNSNNYKVWTSRLGEVDKKPSSSSQVLVSTQPILGALYKSQNASNWQPTVTDDLTFKLYRAEFATSGSISFFNPDLAEGNAQIPILVQNPITSNSRRIKIGISSALSDNNFILGNSVIQLSTGAYGNYVGSVGKASGLSILNGGLGYAPLEGNEIYSAVALKTLTGTGKDATANITVENGVVATIALVSGGTGYSVGDVLTATFGTTSTGTNLKINVTSVSDVNQLVIDNVQGNFIAGVANTIYKYTSAGVTTAIINSSGSELYISDAIDVVSDGLHFKVNHKNHGMHSNTNYVTLKGVLPDVSPTTITVPYTKDYNGEIAIGSVSGFEIFENLLVSGANPGYILVNEEIIKYEGVSNGQLITITRGIDNSVRKAITSGDVIYKYEYSGVSLRRINKTHRLSDSTVANSVGLNYYYIKLNTKDSDYGVDRSNEQSTYIPLYFNDTTTAGGNIAKATQNIPFEAVTPNIQTFIPNLTSVNAQIRTVSGTSISGSETSFIDQGYESVILNRTNYLNSPRIIASKVNEKNLLPTLPGNKSLTMSMNLATDNTRLSPIIDTTRVNIITTSNRINSVFTDYKTDPRVNSFFEDPSDCQYVTKIVRLKNPARSIKLFLSAHINVDSDIRAFYAIDNSENGDPVFIPFPGYQNLDVDGDVINFANNDGTSDKFIDKNYINQSISTIDSYANYEFTANNLPDFKYFRIKIVLTSINQAYVPKIKDMRALALA
jgi:hypothetical protein